MRGQCEIIPIWQILHNNTKPVQESAAILTRWKHKAKPMTSTHPGWSHTAGWTQVQECCITFIKLHFTWESQAIKSLSHVTLKAEHLASQRKQTGAPGGMRAGWVRGNIAVGCAGSPWTWGETHSNCTRLNGILVVTRHGCDLSCEPGESGSGASEYLLLSK